MAKKYSIKIKETLRNKYYSKLNIVLFTLIIVELIFSAGYFLSLNKSFMNDVALATTVKPETFTELYFENHLSLPSTVTQNQTITFKFTVHNLEYKTYTYPYTIYLQVNSKKKEIDNGTFTLNQDGYKTIKETYTITQPITRAKVDVDLTNKNQDIFFWINGKGENAIQ